MSEASPSRCRVRGRRLVVGDVAVATRARFRARLAEHFPQDKARSGEGGIRRAVKGPRTLLRTPGCERPRGLSHGKLPALCASRNVRIRMGSSCSGLGSGKKGNRRGCGRENCQCLSLPPCMLPPIHDLSARSSTRACRTRQTWWCAQVQGAVRRLRVDARSGGCDASHNWPCSVYIRPLWRGGPPIVGSLTARSQ